MNNELIALLVCTAFGLIYYAGQLVGEKTQRRRIVRQLERWTNFLDGSESPNIRRIAPLIGALSVGADSDLTEEVSDTLMFYMRLLHTDEQFLDLAYRDPQIIVELLASVADFTNSEIVKDNSEPLLKS